MKLNTHIDGYDVKSLSGIKSAVVKMKTRCENMENYGELLKNNINVARDNGFQSVNCDKAESIINEYRKKLNSGKMEFEELAKSVDDFSDKIDNIWNSWT